MCLTPYEIAQIEEIVERSGVSFSHLAHDLTDHLCCDIEHRIENGESFKQAFEKVKEQIGIEGLKQIEDQTILLINQNYVIMKKSMKVLSVILVSLFVLSAIFKMFHLPGATILILLNMAGLIFGYIPLLFLSRNKEDIERKYVYVNLSGYVATTVFAISLMFSMNHWPLKDNFMIFSWVAIAIFLVTYLLAVVKKENNAIKATHVGVLVLVSMLLTLEVIYTIAGKNSPNLKYDVVSNNIEQMSDMNRELLTNTYIAISGDSTISSLKLDAVMKVRKEFEAVRVDLHDLATDIENINDFNTIRFVDKRIENYDERVLQLKQSLDNLKKEILSVSNNNSKYKTLVEHTLETDYIDGAWAKQMYFERPMQLVKNNLLRIENDLLYLEFMLLKQIRNQF